MNIQSLQKKYYTEFLILIDKKERGYEDTMNKSAIIDCMKKYRELASNAEERKCFDEVIELMQSKSKKTPSSLKEKTSDALVFNAFLEKNTLHPEQYFSDRIRPEISENKNTMLEYWNQLDDEKKTKFTMVQMHIILYMISGSKNYCKIPKADMIKKINRTVNEILEHKGFKKFVL